MIEPRGSQEPLLRVYLHVAGNFDPQEFGASLGLLADEIKRRGERDPSRLIPRCDSWTLKVIERRSYDVEAAVEELLVRVKGYEDRIAAAARAQGLSVSLLVAAFWNPAESSSPALSLGTEQITCLSQMGAFLDVDLYPLCREKQEDAP